MYTVVFPTNKLSLSITIHICETESGKRICKFWDNHPLRKDKNKMFAGLSGIADKFSSFIREPVTPLGTSIHDAIYATSYGSPNYQKVFLLFEIIVY